MATFTAIENKEYGRYSPVGGSDLYYEVHGTNGQHPPVVLLHGAVLPGTTHYPGFVERSDRVLAMVLDFLNVGD